MSYLEQHFCPMQLNTAYGRSKSSRGYLRKQFEESKIFRKGTMELFSTNRSRDQIEIGVEKDSSLMALRLRTRLGPSAMSAIILSSIT